MQTIRHPFSVVLAASLSLVLAAFSPTVLRATDFYVDNRAGDDRFDGSSPLTSQAGAGPFRSIARALRAVSKGDRISVANTGVPYRESLTVQGGRQSGLELLGNGAILDGLAAVPPRAWKPAGGGLFRLATQRMSYQLLYLDGRPASRVAVSPGDLRLPALQPLQWCLFERYIYFRPEPGKLPDEYDLAHTGLPVGITLYETRQILIRDLIVQGFQLDGVNAHDIVFDATFQRVTFRGNARSGISVGGASQVRVEDCISGSNGAAQLRTEAWSHVRVIGGQLIEDTAPAVVQDGGQLQIEAGPAADQQASQRLEVRPAG